MRPLTEEELRLVFEKLRLFIGPNIQHLIERKDGIYTFRLHKERVYYLSETQLKMATSIAHDNLLSVGTCFGKFSKSRKFRLNITCLDYIAQYAQHKVWVKPNAEMSFLYGNNVTKTGLAKITEGVPQYGGVVVFNLNNVALGFGLAAQPTEYCRDLDPLNNVVLHQGDVGEYLREEDGLL